MPVRFDGENYDDQSLVTHRSMYFDSPKQHGHIMDCRDKLLASFGAKPIH